MDEEIVRMQAQMYAQVAEMYSLVADIEKMKADNRVSENEYESPQWTGENFATMGRGLAGIASALRNRF